MFLEESIAFIVSVAFCLGCVFLIIAGLMGFHEESHCDDNKLVVEHKWYDYNITTSKQQSWRCE